MHRTKAIAARVGLAAIAFLALTGVACAQGGQAPADPQSRYDEADQGWAGGWGNTSVGVAGRPYIKRLSITNAGTETVVIDNTTGAASVAPALGMNVSATVQGYNICRPGQTPGPGSCYALPNRIAVSLEWLKQGEGWTSDFTGATTTPIVDAASVIDITVGFRPAYASLRWTWLSGAPSWWSNSVTAAGGEVRVRYTMSTMPILSDADYAICGTQIPVGSCTAQTSQREIMRSEMILSMDDTVNAVFTGALFATEHAIIGSLETPPVVPGLPPTITYGVAAPHLLADGQPRVGTFRAVLPDSVLAAFGTSSAVFDPATMSVVRTNDPGGGAYAPTWSQWTAAGNGSDGELLTITPLTFSAPKFKVASKSGRFATVKRGKVIALAKLARATGVRSAAGAALSATLAKGASKRFCKVTGAGVKGVKAGACRVVLSSTLTSGKKTAKTVNVVVA